MACVNVAPATFPVFVYLYCVSIFVNLYLCFCIAVGTACVNVAPAAFPGTTMSPWQSRNTTYNSIFCSVWRFQRTRCIMIFCQLWACCVCEFRTWMRLLCLSLGTFLCSWLKVEVNKLSLHFCLNKDQHGRCQWQSCNADRSSGTFEAAAGLEQMDSNHKIDSALPTRAFKTQISVHLLIIKTNSAAEPCQRSKASGW